LAMRACARAAIIAPAIIYGAVIVIGDAGAAEK